MKTGSIFPAPDFPPNSYPGTQFNGWKQNNLNV